MNAEDGRRVYAELSEYAAVRANALSTMLEPLPRPLTAMVS
jgi:hypothetical protein